ncbi:MAG TPA: Na+/H+ antiporter subunit E [Longimicrobiales bacterium]|nr:Na+/H+ antiporter subunit E [Longimicrobiales bacterium]
MKVRAVRRVSVGMTLWLASVWLLLSQTLAPAQAVVAVALGAAVAWLVSPLRPLQASVGSPLTIAGLLLTVLLDVVRSNFAVAAIVLGLGGRRVRSGFLDVPLEMRDPHGLASLAMIVTATPGTVWVDLAPDSSRVTLHILDLRDEEYWVRWIKDRYEKPLMRIFE